MRTDDLQENVDVTVLYTEGCPHTNPALEMINSTAINSNIFINLRTILINTQKQAEEHRFLGSPTIQVNGLDIEPAAREAKYFCIT